MFEFLKSFRKRDMLLSEGVEYVVNTLKPHRRGPCSTGGNYRRSIKRLIEVIGDMRINDVEVDHIQKMVYELEERCSLSTVATYYHACRAVFRILHEYGKVQKNPCQIKYSAPENNGAKPRLTLDEMELVVRSAKSLRDEAMFRMFRDSAGRMNEVRLMTRSLTTIRHFFVADNGDKVFCHRNDKIAKGKTKQMVGTYKLEYGDSKTDPGILKFTHETCAALIRYLSSRGFPENDYIWLTNRGNVMSRAAVGKIFRETGKRAGIKNNSPHKWRHGSAIAMRLQGAEMADIKDHLRHRKVAFTIEQYGQLTESEKLDRYIDVISPMIPAIEDTPDSLGDLFE